MAMVLSIETQLSAKEILRKPYHRVVVPDEDGSFSAEISEFPGCIAVGDTGPDALAMLEEVAVSWIEAAMAANQEIPAPSEEPEYSGKTVLRLPRSLHRQAANAAKRDGVSLNQYIVTAVAIYIGNANKTVSQRAMPILLNFTNVLTQVTGPITIVEMPNDQQPHPRWQQYQFGVAGPGMRLVDG